MPENPNILNIYRSIKIVLIFSLLILSLQIASHYNRDVSQPPLPIEITSSINLKMSTLFYNPTAVRFDLRLTML